ncbi:MAG: hypothetical protein GY841_16225 [FCB group bacterium]|nr:hypothetical protein [FCB group bacterium]
MTEAIRLRKDGQPDRRCLGKPRKIDPVKVDELLDAGVSMPDIAQHQGVTTSAIWKYADKNRPEYQYLDRYREYQVDINEAALMRIQIARERFTDSILRTDETDLDALSPNQKVSGVHSLTVAGGIQQDKVRLLKGESTENLAVASAEDEFLRSSGRIRQLEAALVAVRSGATS